MAAQLSLLLQEHIATVMKHYSGQVFAWDVVNEALDENGRFKDYADASSFFSQSSRDGCLHRNHHRWYCQRVCRNCSSDFRIPGDYRIEQFRSRRLSGHQLFGYSDHSS